MLSKIYRLNLSLKENSSIFEKENSSLVSSRFFLAYLRKNNQYLQATCLSPKAVFSKAADRNHYRRLLYSFLEDEIKTSNFSLSNKIDLIIIIKRNFLKDEILLKKDFKDLMEKINAKIL